MWKTLPAVVLLVTSACTWGGAPALSPSLPPPGTASPSDIILPPQGTLVDVGGYSLWIGCQGAGSPTLIMESGNNPDDHAPYVWLNQGPDLAEVTRVCYYDRAGNGWSDRRADERITIGAEATELHSLLAAEGIEPPYVFVAHSFGGMIARSFTLANPGDVTGIVLVDALWEAPGEGAGDGDGNSVVDVRGLDSHTFGHLPLAVVSSESPSFWGGDLALHIQHQVHLAMLTSNVTHVISTTSGHYVMQEEPALVLEAIREVLNAARSGSPLPLCRQTLRALGGTCA